jgi:hypothetical protein
MGFIHSIHALLFDCSDELASDPGGSSMKSKLKNLFGGMAFIGVAFLSFANGQLLVGSFFIIFGAFLLWCFCLEFHK